jgi:hypothetical protein
MILTGFAIRTNGPLANLLRPRLLPRPKADARASVADPPELASIKVDHAPKVRR